MNKKLHSMNKSGSLVLAAAGRTGMPIALQLLDEGFPVTALVHSGAPHHKKERRPSGK